jgi:hypothetical protein
VSQIIATFFVSVWHEKTFFEKNKVINCVFPPSML